MEIPGKVHFPELIQPKAQEALDIANEVGLELGRFIIKKRGTFALMLGTVALSLVMLPAADAFTSYVRDQAVKPWVDVMKQRLKNPREGLSNGEKYYPEIIIANSARNPWVNVRPYPNTDVYLRLINGSNVGPMETKVIARIADGSRVKEVIVMGPGSGKDRWAVGKCSNFGMLDIKDEQEVANDVCAVSGMYFFVPESSKPSSDPNSK